MSSAGAGYVQLKDSDAIPSTSYLSKLANLLKRKNTEPQQQTTTPSISPATQVVNWEQRVRAIESVLGKFSWFGSPNLDITKLPSTQQQLYTTWKTLRQTLQQKSQEPHALQKRATLTPS